MSWFLMLLLLGASFTLWLLVGGLRLVDERIGCASRRRRGDATSLSSADVAVVVPAHNEEVAIGATLESVLRLVPAGNVHVIADGCEDATAQIAGTHGVQVYEAMPALGKAGGIERAVEHFELCRRFAVLLIVDADTELDERYLERGLAALDETGAVALAGYARSGWQPAELSLAGRLLVAYRSRLYVVMQWMKYGQTWRHTNVTPIVPGFASMYRTEVLDRMDLNPEGLIIEDYNMTFELHHKQLGAIAFTPAAIGTTQDPDNLPDYYRQIRRWWLGFWQTLRRHKLWPSWFCVVLVSFVTEVVIASVVMLLMGTVVLLLLLEPVTGGAALDVAPYADFHATVAPLFTLQNVLLYLWLPDYLLTVAAAVWLRRPSLLVYGVGFIVIRLVDSTAALITLRAVWRGRSSGRWTSPGRRAPGGSAAPPAPPDAGSPVPDTDVTGTGACTVATVYADTAIERRRGALAVLRDATLLVAVLTMGTIAVRTLGVSPLVALVTLVAVVVVACRLGAR
jgi:cellulose synthase/poly-beta-1,6-N-acetylglucosamine synthase-like glycosyltransferase